MDELTAGPDRDAVVALLDQALSAETRSEAPPLTPTGGIGSMAAPDLPNPTSMAGWRLYPRPTCGCHEPCSSGR